MPKNPVRVAAGKKSKRKGSSNERRLSKLFKDWWGHGEFERTPSSGGWATKAVREAFKTCGDIITTAQDFPFCIEAKKQEGWCIDQLLNGDSPALWTWWQQAVEETPPSLIPLLVAARNHVPDVVMVKSKSFYDAKFDAAWDIISQKAYLILVIEREEYAVFSLKSLLSVSPDIFGRKMTCQVQNGVIQSENEQKQRDTNSKVVTDLS